MVLGMKPLAGQIKDQSTFKLDNLYSITLQTFDDSRYK